MFFWCKMYSSYERFHIAPSFLTDSNSVVRSSSPRDCTELSIASNNRYRSIRAKSPAAKASTIKTSTTPSISSHPQWCWSLNLTFHPSTRSRRKEAFVFDSYRYLPRFAWPSLTAFIDNQVTVRWFWGEFWKVLRGGNYDNAVTV